MASAMSLVAMATVLSCLVLWGGQWSKGDLDRGHGHLMYELWGNQQSLHRQLLSRGSITAGKDSQSWGRVLLHRNLLQSNAEVDEELLSASRRGDVQRVKELLDQLANPNARSEDRGLTPIILAAFGGHKDVVRELISRGANVSAVTDTGITPLWVAAYAGHDDVVAELLDEAVDIDHRDVNGTTPLYVAALNGQSSVVKQLVDGGADLNARSASGATPLMAAVHRGNNEIVAILLEAGGDPNLLKEKSGQSILWTATFLLRDEIMKMLIEAGADVNVAAKDGTSPLFISIVRECIACATLLLNEGADANQQRGTDNWSPLHVAASVGFVDGVKLLLEYGADRTLQDHITRRPVDVIGRMSVLPSDVKKELQGLLAVGDSEEGEGPQPPPGEEPTETPVIETLAPVDGETQVRQSARSYSGPPDGSGAGQEKQTATSSTAGGLAYWTVALLTVLAILVVLQSLYIIYARRKRRAARGSDRSAESPFNPVERGLSAQSYVATSPVTVVSPHARFSDGNPQALQTPFSPTQNVPPGPPSPETRRPAAHPMLESFNSDMDDSQGLSMFYRPMNLGLGHQPQPIRTDWYGDPEFPTPALGTSTAPY